MTDTTEDDPMWMVVTLKSGTQLRMKVTEYTVSRHVVTQHLDKLSWVKHSTSPTKLTELDLGEVAAIHTEYMETPNA